MEHFLSLTISDIFPLNIYHMSINFFRLRQIRLWVLSLFIVGPICLLGQQTVQLSGEFVNCQEDTLYLFAMDGLNLRPYQAIPLAGTSGTHTFSTSLEQLPAGFYVLGDIRAQNAKMLILGPDRELKLTGPCNNLNQLTIWQSPVNDGYREVLEISNQHRRDMNSLIYQFRQAKARGQNLEPVIAEMKKIDLQKLALLDSLKTHAPLLANVIGPRTYLSFENYGQGYLTEALYFASTYFKYTDLTDPLYSRTPALHEAFRTYAMTMTKLGFTQEKLEEHLSHWLEAVPDSSPARSTALLGIVFGLRNQNEDAFSKFVQRYLDKFADQNPQLTQQLEAELKSIQAQLIGAQAPEIALPNVEGDTIRLSDLKGKVVLIDFWASWCGPCRRENPRVVALYNKYKDQGFEILGVSLDREANSWKRAIEDDGLTWVHVSDLKYFRSVAAQTYGVDAIPYTVLVDEEGKILAKRLRGEQLAEKLAAIFSEKNDEGLR